jgi:hypothetical protein
MASTKPVTAIVERLKAKAKLPNEADHDWIKFPRAVTEVIEAFGICSEAASMMLFGLIATGQVRALDNHQGFIDLDDCAIADCPPSALMRQIGWVEEGRISGSS